MKKHALVVTGNVSMYSQGALEVDGVDVLIEFTKSFGMKKEDYQLKHFAGKVEITITDLTEPLVIDASKDERMEE